MGGSMGGSGSGWGVRVDVNEELKFLWGGGSVGGGGGRLGGGRGRGQGGCERRIEVFVKIQKKKFGGGGVGGWGGGGGAVGGSGWGVRVDVNEELKFL